MGYNKDNPLVSIVTVVFNGEKFIQDTIESVLQQDYKNKEYIIVDGGSDDGTVSIIERYRNLITFISEPDRGIYDAMNKGIGMAKGEIVNFLNCGDIYFDESVLCDVVEGFKENEMPTMLYGRARYIEEDGRDYYLKGVLQESEDRHSRVVEINHQTLFYTRALHEKYGGYDLHYRLAADYDFMQKVLKNERNCPVYLNRLTVKYRVNGVSRGIDHLKECIQINHHYRVGFTQKIHHYKKLIKKTIRDSLKI